jgi:alkylhydroperoxidase family enzyme
MIGRPEREPRTLRGFAGSGIAVTSLHIATESVAFRYNKRSRQRRKRMSRIAALAPPYAPEIQKQFDRIMRGAPPLVLFRVMAGHVRAWDKFRGGSLLDPGPLPLREREIVIDRTCALNRCEYEWGVHVGTFAQAARLTPEQIRATLHEDPDAPCWSAAEQALLAAVDGLHHRASLSEEEFIALSDHYDDDQILEIILLCGFYRTVSYLANSLALPLETNAARFPAMT